MKSVFILVWASLDVYFSGKYMKYICLGEQPYSSVHRANNRFPLNSFFRPWKPFLSWVELHWTYISRENTWSIFAWANKQIALFAGRITDNSQKGSFDIKKRFYLGLSSLDVYFSRKYMQYIRPGEQPDSNDRRGITRFPWKSFFRQWKASFGPNHFSDSLKRLKKGPFGLEKRFCLGLCFIGRLFLEKTHEVYPPGRTTRLQCSPGE